MITPKLHPYQKQILEGTKEDIRLSLYGRRMGSSFLRRAEHLTVEQAEKLVEGFRTRHSYVAQVWRSKA